MFPDQIFLGLVILKLAGVWCSYNVTNFEVVNLPAIKMGDSCDPNKLYRMDCNTCKCGMDNVLLCTKMACLTKEDVNRVKMIHRKANVRTGGKTYPNLPQGKCAPGKIYQSNCHKCFCDNKGKATCSSIDNCNTDFSKEIITPEHIRPKYTPEDFAKLPELPNAASKCDAGVTYRVDCNTCLCMANRNLNCGFMLCFSPNDMNRLKAQRLSGTSCENSNDVKAEKCVKCSCVDRLLKCKPIPDCVDFTTTETRSVHGNIKPSFKLSLEKSDNCVPFSVYRDKCNKCYCQQDGTMRCTQKTCLNYVQTLKLKRQLLYLKKHGL